MTGATAMLVRRQLNEVLRVPGAAIPGVLAPSIFMLGILAVFGNLTHLRGFPTNDYLDWSLPVALMQGASFAGAATGVNTARDIEQGWFDRMLVAPLARWRLLLATVVSASARALLPMAFTLVIGFAFGVRWPGVGGLLLSLALAAAFAAVAAAWTTALALYFRTQSAAPLMQASMFMLVLFTTSYTPQNLLSGFMADVARWNPVTKVLEGVRQAFLAHVTWATTWPALVVIVGLMCACAALALRNISRMGV